MMIKNLKSKISTILIAGLIVSSVTVLAFADDAKKEAVAESLKKQEAEVQLDDKADTLEAEIKIDTEEEIKTEENEAEIKIEDEAKSDTKEQAEDKAEGSLQEEGTAEDLEKGALADASKDETDIELYAEIVDDTTEGIEAKEGEETKNEELLDDIELATASNLKLSEEALDKAILGTWAADEYTALRFDDGGQGCMLLPESEYEFAYELDGDTLSIDFISSRANDASYTISISDESMILTLTYGTLSKDIALHKTK